MRIFSFAITLLLLTTVWQSVYCTNNKWRGLNNPNWVYQATETQGITGSKEGYAVALSADGNTLAVGAPELHLSGGTQIYTRFNAQWKHQAMLTQAIANTNEGYAVALSTDGNMLMVGAPNYGADYNGAVFIYARFGSLWKYQTALTRSALDGSLGTAVTLSKDGNTLAIGALVSGNKRGVTVIYTWQGSEWMHQATVSQEVSGSYEGSSVALSADGNILAAGAPGYPPGINGATQMYVRSGDTWQYVATLTQNVENSSEGVSVALSNDGSILAAAAGSGITQMYVNSTNGWNYHGTLEKGGSCVAMSPDGATVIAGDPLFNNTGGARVYALTSNKWTYVTTLTQQLAGSEEGRAVALANATLASGIGILDNTREGATAIYVKEL